METPSESPDRIDAEAQRHLLDNLERARELGAEVVKLQSADPIAVLLDFARSHRVKHVILGRSRDPWWKRMLGRTFLLKFLQESDEFDVTVAALDEEEKTE